MTPTPTQSDVQTALRAFLMSVLPSGVDVVEGQDNRVSEPSDTDFVVMTTILRERLSTNFDQFQDCSFIGSVSGATLTVTSVNFGTIQVGNTLFGAGVSAGTTIASLGTGTGGTGTYTLSAAQTVTSSKMAAGTIKYTQSSKFTVQLDFHSANVGDSSDMAETVSTLFRDGYATDYFASVNANVIPLHADEPRQVPFQNAESQWETRWIVDAKLQVNRSVTAPQQFADQLQTGLVAVNNEYPA